tara:strand:+ start:2891 stop:3508 length:618 start_codon:yes stop_codon:yes gene_type:complete
MWHAESMLSYLNYGSSSGQSTIRKAFFRRFFKENDIIFLKTVDNNIIRQTRELRHNSRPVGAFKVISKNPIVTIAHDQEFQVGFKVQSLSDHGSLTMLSLRNSGILTSEPVIQASQYFYLQFNYHKDTNTIDSKGKNTGLHSNMGKCMYHIDTPLINDYYAYLFLFDEKKIGKEVTYEVGDFHANVCFDLPNWFEKIGLRPHETQ